MTWRYWIQWRHKRSCHSAPPHLLRTCAYLWVCFTCFSLHPNCRGETSPSICGEYSSDFRGRHAICLASPPGCKLLSSFIWLHRWLVPVTRARLQGAPALLWACAQPPECHHHHYHHHHHHLHHHHHHHQHHIIIKTTPIGSSINGPRVVRFPFFSSSLEDLFKIGIIFSLNVWKNSLVKSSATFVVGSS